MQQGEDVRGTVGGGQVEVGHAPPDERVSRSEVVVDGETGHHRGDASAELGQGEQVGHGVAEGPAAFVGAAERDLRHGVLQHPRTDRVSFGVVGVEEVLG